MTKIEARRWLRAVESLIAYYQGENNDWIGVCPFCEIVDKYYFDCQNCLCPLFEGMQCGDYLDVIERDTRPPEWCAIAIPRLRRWKRRLLKIAGIRRSHEK